MVPGEEPSGPDPEEGPVLVPEELDITDDDHVTQLDETRFVVSPDERPEDEPVDILDTDTPDLCDRETITQWLAEDLAGTDSRYGFDITASFDDVQCHRRMVSNDVVTIFETLVLWYAQQIDADTPVEEVLGILLWESNAPVRYPPRSLRALVDATDLDADDAIADLLAAVDEEAGVTL